MTRAFIEATLSLPSLQRLTEPLHYALIRYLVPELHQMPFGNAAWLPQNRNVNPARLHARNLAERITRRLGRLASHARKPPPVFSYVDPMFDRIAMFEQKRDAIRECALDSASLPFWDYIDRQRFERLMHPTTDFSVRSRSLQLLYITTTLVYYETDTMRRAFSLARDDWPAVVASRG